MTDDVQSVIRTLCMQIAAIARVKRGMGCGGGRQGS